MVKDPRLWIGRETSRGETSWRQFESARGYPYPRQMIVPSLGTTVLSHKEIQGLRNADEPFRVSSDEFTVEIKKLLPGGDGEDLASGMRSDTL